MEYIERAINSVLNQTYQNFEIIIVDDNSSDCTAKIIEDYQNRDKRFKFVKHKTRKGAAAARNTGIKIATGEYISFLDSDDEWLPNKLECELKVMLENKDCIICSCNHVFVNGICNKIVIEPVLKNSVVSQKIVLRGECFTTNDFTVKREALIKINGYDESLPARQDWDLWIRITSLGMGIQIPVCGARIYLMHGDQISRGIKNKLNGTEFLFNKHRNLFYSDPCAFSRICSSLGILHLLAKNTIEATNYFEESYKNTSKRVKRLKLLLMIKSLEIFGGVFNKAFVFYYKLKNPDSYLIW